MSVEEAALPALALVSLELVSAHYYSTMNKAAATVGLAAVQVTVTASMPTLKLVP